MKAILTEGPNVRAVANLGRTIPAYLRGPLEARDPTCVVPGCEATEDLEIHYFTDPIDRIGRTRLKDVCHVCWGHGLLIRQRGWRVAGRPGGWQWLPPDPGLSPPSET